MFEGTKVNGVRRFYENVIQELLEWELAQLCTSVSLGAPQHFICWRRLNVNIWNAAVKLVNCKNTLSPFTFPNEFTTRIQLLQRKSRWYTFRNLVVRKTHRLSKSSPLVQVPDSATYSARMRFTSVKWHFNFVELHIPISPESSHTSTAPGSFRLCVVSARFPCYPVYQWCTGKTLPGLCAPNTMKVSIFNLHGR